MSLKLVCANKIGNNEWRLASDDNPYTPQIEKALFEGIENRLAK